MANNLQVRGEGNFGDVTTYQGVHACTCACMRACVCSHLAARMILYEDDGLRNGRTRGSYTLSFLWVSHIGVCLTESTLSCRGKPALLPVGP